MWKVCSPLHPWQWYTNPGKQPKKKCYSKQLKRSLGDRGRKIQPWVTNEALDICATREGGWNNRSTQALKEDWSTARWTEKSGRRWKQHRKSGLRSSARPQRREWCQKTAKRPTTPLSLSPKCNSLCQQSSKTAVETFWQKSQLL